MITITCCHCAVDFAVTDALYNFRRRDNAAFHCPNGHSQSYTEKEGDRLRKTIVDRDATIMRLGTQISETEARIEGRDRRINSLKGVITRMKNKKKSSA